MASITFQSVTFSYESAGRELFRDLSLRIESHWKTALIGRNGRGKTTLLKLIAGAEQPSAGSVECPLQTLYFPHVPRDPAMTTFAAMRESLAPFAAWEAEMERLARSRSEADLTRFATLQERFERAGGYAIDAAIEREFAQVGLPAALLEAPFGRLSGGEQTRALIAALFLQPSLFALIDEPTNHLDMEGRERLTAYLATKPGFLLVSHDRSFLDACTDHVVALNADDVRVCVGNYSTWREQMDRELAHQGRTRARLEREANQLKRAAAQRRDWAQTRERDKTAHVDKGFIGHRAAKQMRRAAQHARRTRERLEDREALLRNIEKERVLKVTTTREAPATLVTVHNLRLRTGARILCEELSFTVRRGDRIAITGRNGCGKTTLFETICGKWSEFDGVIRVPAHVRIERAYQMPIWTQGFLRDYLAEAAFDESRFRQILGVLGVDSAIFEQPLESFSQGELKKTDLCRCLMSSADLLLWDEPTNYVDLHAREQLRTAILQSAPTLLFIDHDRRFVEEIATGVIAFPTPADHPAR